MIGPNLISDKAKKDLKMLDLYIGTKNFIFLILFSVTIFSIILLLGKLFLQNQFNATVSGNYLNNNLGKYSSQEVRIFNRELKNATEIQKEFIPWSEILFHFTKLINQGILLNSLHVDRALEIKIEGVAKTREDLLTFKDSLEKSEFIERFNIPLELLFKKENIQFDLSLKIIPERITE